MQGPRETAASDHAASALAIADEVVRFSRERLTASAG